MKDISNEKFNMLTVIKFDKIVLYNGRARTYKWLCLCDCGKTISVPVSALKNGQTKSCGCFKKKKLFDYTKSEEHKSKDGEAALHCLYLIYKNQALKRNLIFELSKEEFRTLTKNNCYYCNTVPSQIKKSKISFYIYNGVDRVDNQKGYILDNSVSCCKKCNMLKSAVTKEIILKAAEFLKPIPEKKSRKKKDAV